MKRLFPFLLYFRHFVIFSYFSFKVFFFVSWKKDKTRPSYSKRFQRPWNFPDKKCPRLALYNQKYDFFSGSLFSSEQFQWLISRFLSQKKAIHLGTLFRRNQSRLFETINRPMDTQIIMVSKALRKSEIMPEWGPSANLCSWCLFNPPIKLLFFLLKSP